MSNPESQSAGGREGSTSLYMTASEAAKAVGCSVSTVSRAAARAGVGVFAGGRLVALTAGDIEAVRLATHRTPGNPKWIAASKPAAD